MNLLVCPTVVTLCSKPQQHSFSCRQTSSIPEALTQTMLSAHTFHCFKSNNFGAFRPEVYQYQEAYLNHWIIIYDHYTNAYPHWWNLAASNHALNVFGCVHAHMLWTWHKKFLEVKNSYVLDRWTLSSSKISYCYYKKFPIKH